MVVLDGASGRCGMRGGAALSRACLDVRSGSISGLHRWEGRSLSQNIVGIYASGEMTAPFGLVEEATVIQNLLLPPLTR
jgi:hypothetical protein